MTGQIQIRTHKESRLKAEELLEAVFIPSVTEYNSMLRIMVSSHLQEAETQELEDLINKPFPRKGHIQSAYPTALFEVSGITTHM
jgi:hypothetical protein